MAATKRKTIGDRMKPPPGHSDPVAVAAALNEIRNSATVSVVTAGLVLGLGVNVSYREAAKGSIPTIRLGHQLRVPSGKLLEMLGLPIPAPAQPEHMVAA